MNEKCGKRKTDYKCRNPQQGKEVAIQIMNTIRKIGGKTHPGKKSLKQINQKKAVSM